MKDDLREWLQKADEMGKLRRLEGADWDLEIAAASILSLRENQPPAVLFDDIKGWISTILRQIL